MGRKASKASPFPSAPCCISGCPARSQRQWSEPDGLRRCIGHSRAPEALKKQRKAGDVGRGKELPDDPDGSGELMENRAELAGAPKVMPRSDKDFAELISTKEGRDYLRAWILQGVVLKALEPDRTSVARAILKDIEDLAEKNKTTGGWEESPLYQSLRALIDEVPEGSPVM